MAALGLPAGHRVREPHGQGGRIDRRERPAAHVGGGPLPKGEGVADLYRCWNFGTSFNSIAQFQQQHPDCGSAWRQVRERLVDSEKLIADILGHAAKLSVADRQVLVQRLTGPGTGEQVQGTATPGATNA